MSDTYDSSYDATASTYEVAVTEPTYAPSTEPVYDPASALPTDTTWVETGSTTGDTTDWSAVSEVSTDYMEAYQADATIGNELYQASVDAYIAGDDMASYELNQASIAAYSSSDANWDASGQVWSDMAETTTTTSYDAVDTSYDTTTVDTSYDTTSYDTTSYDTTTVDTSYDTTSYDTTSYDTTTVDTSSSYVDTSTTYDTTSYDTTSYDTSSDY